MNGMRSIRFIPLLYDQSHDFLGGTVKVFVVVDFFLFASFSFFVGVVGNTLAMFRWHGLSRDVYGFSDVRDAELPLYGADRRPRTGLFRLGVGETALGGLDRLGKFWSLRVTTGCRESSAIVGCRPLQAPCPNHFLFGGSTR